MPFVEGVMEGGRLGKSKGVGGFRDRGASAEKEIVQNALASLLNQLPVRD